MRQLIKFTVNKTGGGEGGGGGKANPPEPLLIRHCLRCCYHTTSHAWQTLQILNEPRHEISNNVVCATSKGSDQPARTLSLIRAFASRLNILWVLRYLLNMIDFGVSKLRRRLHRLVWIYTCQDTTLLEITCRGSNGCCTMFSTHKQNEQNILLTVGFFFKIQLLHCYL